MSVIDLFPKDGIYDNTRRFAFTNITDDLFTFHWDGKPISIKAHDVIEMPHYLAAIATRKLIDKIMVSKFKKEEEDGINVGKDGRHRFGLSLGVPAARQVYEDQIVRELALDEESPQVAIMRAQMRDEIMGDIKRAEEKTAPVESVVASVGLDTFSQVKEGGKTEEYAGVKKGKTAKK